MDEIERLLLRVLLYEGKWRRKPSKKTVENALRHTVSARGAVLDLSFVDPIPDVAFEIELAVNTDLDWGDQENVCDDIVERLLRSFDPEYESMVEVEIEDAR